MSDLGEVQLPVLEGVACHAGSFVNGYIVP